MTEFESRLSQMAVTEKESVFGTWKYTPTFIGTREADGYTFKFGEEDSTWTGTFDGTSYDVFFVVVHPSGIMHVPYGLIFFEGTVDGKSGTLVIRFVGKKTVEPQLWSGEWVILSGEGDLENLRGQGTFWGPSLDLDYSGKIQPA